MLTKETIMNKEIRIQELEQIIEDAQKEIEQLEISTVDQYILEGMQKMEHIDHDEIEEMLLNQIVSSKIPIVNNAQYTMFLVERIIELVIEYYNNQEKDENHYWQFNCNNFKVDYDTFSDIPLTIKKSMYMKSYKVAKKCHEVLTNYNSKNLLKYYFTGEF